MDFSGKEQEILKLAAQVEIMEATMEVSFLKIKDFTFFFFFLTSPFCFSYHMQHISGTEKTWKLRISKHLFSLFYLK